MKKFKPTTPGRRGSMGINYRLVLSGDSPLKSLVKGVKRAKGRNSQGRITMRHRGGGVKRRLRDIDFKYDKRGIAATVETIEYDPNRSAFIARVLFRDGERRYVVAPQSVKVGDIMITSDEAPLIPGNRTRLGRIPVGMFVYNVEIKPESGAKLARSAGNAIEVLAQDEGNTHLKMPSSEVRKVPSASWASIGAVSNEEHRLKVLGKAGRSRLLGRRPTVRGAAMNPVDHPHGGGEGRAGRGHRRQRTKWGKPAGKGQKTRNPKKYSNSLIVRRRKVGKKRR